ncbi:MAG: hypothetical protein DWQ49_09455 [Bacteroidetes bacterium]|nr:MAG: hypothetical protein DWQ49_09455 [Bacteroidota bacterium]
MKLNKLFTGQPINGYETWGECEEMAIKAGWRPEMHTPESLRDSLAEADDLGEEDQRLLECLILHCNARRDASADMIAADLEDSPERAADDIRQTMAAANPNVGTNAGYDESGWEAEAAAGGLLVQW